MLIWIIITLIIIYSCCTYKQADEPAPDEPAVPFDKRAYDLAKEYGHPYNQLWLDVCKSTNYCTKVPKHNPEPVSATVSVPVPKPEKPKRKERESSPRYYTGMAGVRHRCIGHIPSLQRAIQIKRGYMKRENNLTNIDETAMLTFLTETKNGEFGVISTTASQLPRIEVRREDAAEPVYYYSFE